MRRRRKQTTFNPKYECFWVEKTHVTEILEKNKSYEKNIKNAFKCESKKGEPRTCIYWSRVPESLEAGSLVSMHGRLENNVFIVKKLLVYPKAEEGKAG